VRLGFADVETQAGAAPGATVVFVMNHRSNMDYVPVAFLAAERTTLSHAVGEWADLAPAAADPLDGRLLRAPQLKQSGLSPREAHDARLYVPRGDRDYAIHVGLRMLALRRLVEERDGMFDAVLDERALLAYYANSVAHLRGR
jgi:glycerol-3-phosphate O-acyltransferase